MAASIDSLLEEIAGVEDPVEELQSLKTALLAIPVSVLKDSIRGQRLDVIFSLLTSSDRCVWLCASAKRWRITAESVSGYNICIANS